MRQENSFDNDMKSKINTNDQGDNVNSYLKNMSAKNSNSNNNQKSIYVNMMYNDKINSK